MKRHTKQNSKQKHGRYFTTNASTLLEGYEDVVRGVSVTEPFAGGGDLVEWCKSVGAGIMTEFDIEPQRPETHQRDSIIHPILGSVVVTNPPYLSRNKNKDKTPYDIWNQDDLYKCHLAALVANKVDRGILILPSNFLSERHSRARDMFFSYYRMNKVKYYRTQVFDDATTGVVVFDFSRWISQKEMHCDVTVYYDDEEYNSNMTFSECDGWLCGRDFFSVIDASPNTPVKILRDGMQSNSNIIIGLLDNGKYSLGAHYNDGEAIYCSPKTFTTYQCVLEVVLSEVQQKKVVELFNTTLNHYRDEYHSMFLSNYMGSKQKIMSRYYAERLLNHCIREIS